MTESENLTVTDEKVTLKSLSKLTGFSEEIIAKELKFTNGNGIKKDVSLGELRQAMIAFLDSDILAD